MAKYGESCELYSTSTIYNICIQSGFLILNLLGLMWCVSIILKSKFMTSAEVNRTQLMFTNMYFISTILKRLNIACIMTNIWVHKNAALLHFLLFVIEGIAFSAVLIYMLNIWLDVISNLKYFRANHLGKNAKRITFVINIVCGIGFVYAVLRSSIVLACYMASITFCCIGVIFLIVSSQLGKLFTFLFS